MQTDEIVRRYRKGETQAEIAERAGVSRQRVSQLLVRHLDDEERAGITQARRRRNRVSWACEECEEEQSTAPSQVGRFCSIECSKADRRRRFYEDPTQFAYRNRADGHLWVRHPDGRKMRVERAIAELMENRELGSNEWVTLKDGDPDNLDPSNIEITTPKEIARRAREEG